MLLRGFTTWKLKWSTLMILITKVWFVSRKKESTYIIPLLIILWIVKIAALVRIEDPSRVSGTSSRSPGVRIVYSSYFSAQVLPVNLCKYHIFFVENLICYVVNHFISTSVGKRCIPSPSTSIVVRLCFEEEYVS